MAVATGRPLAAVNPARSDLTGSVDDEIPGPTSIRSALVEPQRLPIPASRGRAPKRGSHGRQVAGCFGQEALHDPRLAAGIQGSMATVRHPRRAVRLGPAGAA